MSLRGKTLFITGASRGIGKAIAIRAAQDGANIVVAAKTAEPHPTLPGTIYTAAEEIRQAGGRALPVVCDVRSEEQVKAAVEQAVATFGGIDILLNNASAVGPISTEEMSVKKFDLVNSINARGTWLVSKYCLPHLKKSSNPHILNMSPPLDFNTSWYEQHIGYTLSKMGASLCVLGMAAEFREYGIAVNALWPLTIINTSVLTPLGDQSLAAGTRTPAIMVDAAYIILTKPSRSFTGQFCIDEVLLREKGVTDFAQYEAVPGSSPLIYDLFIDEEYVQRIMRAVARPSHL